MTWLNLGIKRDLIRAFSYGHALTRYAPNRAFRNLCDALGSRRKLIVQAPFKPLSTDRQPRNSKVQQDAVERSKDPENFFSAPLYCQIPTRETGEKMTTAGSRYRPEITAAPVAMHPSLHRLTSLKNTKDAPRWHCQATGNKRLAFQLATMRDIRDVPNASFMK